MTEKPKTPYFDLPATPEQLEAVGRVAAAWSYLESVIEAAIWKLCMLEERQGRALTTYMNLKMRIDSLQTLLHVSGDDESARDLKRRRDQIEDLGRERNEIIHGLWVRGEYGSPMTLTVRARGEAGRKKDWTAPGLNARFGRQDCSNGIRASRDVRGQRDLQLSPARHRGRRLEWRRARL